MIGYCLNWEQMMEKYPSLKKSDAQADDYVEVRRCHPNKTDPALP